MEQLLEPLSGVLTLVLVTAAFAAAVLRFWQMPRLVGRALFVIGVGVAPLFITLALARHRVSEQEVLFMSMYAILAVTIAFIAFSRRPVRGPRLQHRRAVRTDTVCYLVSSVL